jgi:hypothetical protein
LKKQPAKKQLLAQLPQPELLVQEVPLLIALQPGQQPPELQQLRPPQVIPVLQRQPELELLLLARQLVLLS